MVGTVIADSVPADNDLLELRAICEVALPLPGAVGGYVPFEVHSLLERAGRTAGDLPAVVDKRQHRRVVGVLRLAVEKAQAYGLCAKDDDPVPSVLGVGVVGELPVGSVFPLRHRAVPPQHDKRLSHRCKVCELEVEACR